jgi:hypothetical protein
MGAADDRLHLFGIRHHGPGCARSLVGALDALDPEVVLIEGLPECEPLLKFAADPAMEPPVALLLYDEKAPRASIFEPMAAFSPEWQAMRWALRHDRPVRFIDLPAAWTLAAMTAEAEPAVEVDAEDVEDVEDDGGHDADAWGDDSTADAPPLADVDPEAAAAAEIRRDPIGALARIAGHADGDTWWSQLVEAQAHSSALFEALEDALTELRDTAESALLTPGFEDGSLGRAHRERELRREAHMRLAIRKALDETDGPVAVVAGAWHVPALRRKAKVSDDRALLRGAPRVKVSVSWVPWTNTRLARESGYGAGVRSPQWYHHLWNVTADPAFTVDQLVTGWVLRATALLRARGELASTASAIETVRLALSLAALRGVPTPGIDDLRDAMVAVLCGGDPAPLTRIERALHVGDEVGHVGEATPQNPLELDLERQQRRLRLKRRADVHELRLDLRTDSGRGRSTLLHRLRLLGIPWGELADAGRSRGTFRENWMLEWRPELSVALAEAMPYGTTVESAAAAKALEDAEKTRDLSALAPRVRDCLLADLEAVARTCIARLQTVASESGALVEQMEAVPPLVGILRYGEARATPTEALELLVRSLAAEITSGLSYACRQLQPEVLGRTRAAVDGFDRAVSTFEADAGGDGPLTDEWLRALEALADDDLAEPMLRGLSTRRLSDRERRSQEVTAAAFSRALSPTVPPAEASDWLEGFLAESGQVLLYDGTLRGMLDAWIGEVGGETFVELLPMLRRAFSTLDPSERRHLMARLADGATDARRPAEAETGDPAGLRYFEEAMPLLRTILGWETRV